MDRLDSIRKGVFYTKDGKFDPPKSRLMAFRRAIRFGANEKEAASLSGHHPTPSKTTEGFSTWHRVGADGNLEQKTVRTKTRPPSDGGPPWIKGVGSQSAGTQKDRDRGLVQGLVAAGDYKKAGAIIERDFVDEYFDLTYGAKPSAKDIQQHVESRLELLKRIAQSRPAQVAQTTAQQTMPGGGGGQPRTRAEARAILKQNNPGKSNTEIEERLDSMGYPR